MLHKFKIQCPQCGRRIFDISAGSTGVVYVKCSRCKTFSIIDLLTLTDESNL